MVTARAFLFDGTADAGGVKKKLAKTNPGSLVQVARASSASNELMVELMAAQTFRAESSGRTLAKKPEMDLLLRLAGTTQISRAIRLQGAAAGERFLAISASRKEILIPPGFEKMELQRKSLTASELSRVETAALLDVHRG